MNYCADIDCELEGLHCETGPGVWEGALAVTEGLLAADRAAIFKTMAKGYFQRREMMATFMAKWSMDYPGQSGHLHLSLGNADGDNIFYDPAQDHGISAQMRHAVGGLQRYLPEFLVMLAPTVNSYTRLVKGAWAPQRQHGVLRIARREYGLFPVIAIASVSKSEWVAQMQTLIWLRRPHWRRLKSAWKSA